MENYIKELERCGTVHVNGVTVQWDRDDGCYAFNLGAMRFATAIADHAIQKVLEFTGGTPVNFPQFGRWKAFAESV